MGFDNKFIVLELFDPMYTSCVLWCSIFDINKTYYLLKK